MVHVYRKSGLTKFFLRKILLFFLFLQMPLMFSQLQAQSYATEHYLPPFHNVQDGNDITEKVVIHLTTMETSGFNVSLQRRTSSGWTSYGNYTISKTAPKTITINCNNSGDCSYLTAMSTGTGDRFTGMKASGNKPFYVNVDILAGSQAGSYSSKGPSAFGNRVLLSALRSN